MYCSKCGNEIVEEEKFCSKCGNKIEFKNEEEKSEEIESTNKKYVEASKMKKRIIGFVLIGIFSLAIVYIGFMLLFFMTSRTTVPLFLKVVLIGATIWETLKMIIEEITTDTYQGKCPYCNSDLRIKGEAVDCPICKKRIIVKNSRFYQV